MFCSPPKLRRSVCLTENMEVIQRTVAAPVKPCSPALQAPVPCCSVLSQPRKLPIKEVAESSLTMEGSLVDQAVESLLSLPEVVSQVSVLQKDHSLEVQKQMFQMKKLQVDIERSRKQCGEVMQEIASVDRKTRMTEEEVMEAEKTCQTFQKDIQLLVSTCETLRHKLFRQREQCNAEKSKQLSYLSKMESHKSEVKKFESTLPAGQRFCEITAEVDLLRKKKLKLLNDTDQCDPLSCGQKEMAIRKEIKKTYEDINQCEQEITRKQRELSEVQEEKEKIKVAITVLHKRNAAQLTRLKRQVREQELRHRQWQEQQHQLQKSVDESRRRMEE